MKNIIKYQIDKNYSTNKMEYFFTFLNNRFDLINDHLVELLEEKYKKKFIPIFILSAEPGKNYKKKNYIIINKKLKALRRKLGNNKLITLQDLEDLNIEFSESKFVYSVIEKLSKKQERIFLISFTSFGLKIKNSKIINIGPGAGVVEKYDNKIQQIKLFKKLGFPIVETKVFKDWKSLKKAKINFSVFVSPSYTSGGAENGILFSNKDLKAFYKKLRKINLNKKFFISDYIKNIKSSPNSVGIVCKNNDARVLCLTDQLISGVKHSGNIYPSSASKKNIKKMIEITKKTGLYLSKQGFRGLYGCDFIIDSKDKLYITELNPRRQSTYLITQLMSKKVNLLEVELKIALNEKPPKFNYKDIQCDFFWMHNKLKQNQKHQTLINEFKINNESLPFNKVGKSFYCTYFPEKYILNNLPYFGYYIASGKNYNKLLKNSKVKIENILSNSLKKR